MIAYNHENYIKQAIEGVLMQKCDFIFELVIGEDCSSDKTRDTCIDYAAQYPEINLLTTDSNLGMMPNFIRTIRACRGEYIALCEGDDYWTDPLKLRKQVDYLDKHPECSLVFHNTLIFFQDKSRQPLLSAPLSLSNYTTFNTEHIIENLFNISTCSMVFRAKCLAILPDWFNETNAGEKAIQLLTSLQGNATYIEELMSVYRSHSGGISNGKTEEYALKVMSEMYNNFNISTKGKFQNAITKKLKKMNLNFNNSTLRLKYGLFFYLIRPEITFRKIKMRVLNKNIDD
jgi:glycosyltransferase involved in cell wall biosynthesis